MLDIEKMRDIEGKATEVKDTTKELEKMFGFQDPTDLCGKAKVYIDNNLIAIKQENNGDCGDDAYDIGF